MPSTLYPLYGRVVRSNFEGTMARRKSNRANCSNVEGGGRRRGAAEVWIAEITSSLLIDTDEKRLSGCGDFPLGRRACHH